jgi:hypothetical protein
MISSVRFNLKQIQAEIYAADLVSVINFHRKDAKGAKKRYFSFAVDPAYSPTGTPAKEKNPSLRDILGSQYPQGMFLIVLRPLNGKQ